MAKKKTVAYTRLNVKRAIEESLEDGSALVLQHVHEPHGAAFKYFSAQQSGAFHVANKLGFQCRCDPTPTKRGREICRCIPHKRGIIPGHQMIDDTRKEGSYTFDGLGRCRDKKGKLVPLSRCDFGVL